MEVWRDVGSGAAPAGTAVTVGVYDGVHLGHRLLIETTRAAARDR
ncbi:MAG: bifunctional riboflavin kinase/FAD synthetase, partial [Acidimicrobiales bacterium]